MLRRKFMEFLNDEQGTYTLWSLVWFMLYVALGGLAVDVTDAYRHHTLLQATADSAALAAVMSIGNTSQDPVNVAIKYAEVNMDPDQHGPVLQPVDVQVGTWQFASETFRPNTSDPNAVYVTTRRDSQNDNQVAMNFLLILQGIGLRPSWNLHAEAVAVKGIHVCHNNGIIAGGQLDIKTHTHFLRNICLIGADGMLHRDNNNFFEDGVYAGVGCEAGATRCIGPSENVAFRNDGFNTAFGLDAGGNYLDPTRPLNAANVDTYLNAVIELADQTDGTVYTTYDEWESAYFQAFDGTIDWSRYQYLSPAGAVPLYYEGTSLPVDAAEDTGRYTVYNIECNGNYTLPDGNYQNVALIFSCPLMLSGNYSMSGTLLASTASGPNAIRATGHTDLGAPDCGLGGVEIYTTNGSVHFAASGDVTNTRILSATDVDFAANGNGPVGIHIEAQEDVFMASGSAGISEYGLCPNDFTFGANVFSYSLVR